MTKTKLHLKVEHQVKGRIRMKIPTAKRNPELLEQIKQTFGALPGIQEIKVNPATGSVTLFYDEEEHAGFHSAISAHMQTAPPRPPSGEYDELARKIEEEAEFLADHSEVAREVVNFFKEVDRSLKLATSNLIDLKLVFIILIAGVTLLEVGPSAATPVWVTLVVFSLNHFVEMRPPARAATA